MGAKDYVIEVSADWRAVRADEWNELLGAQAAPTPFMRHEYLQALTTSASAVNETGWGLRVLTLRQDGRLHAACPLYLKAHSWGEYVFDHAWAQAYEQHGLRYYPKLLAAVPFTPATGTRLLARDEDARSALIAALVSLATRSALSSTHALFVDSLDGAAFAQAGWMLRETVQFHWVNRKPAAYADFDDFLQDLRRDKRRKIVQERRRVADSGISFEIHVGAAIDPDAWDFFYRCHEQTYAVRGQAPYLTRAFFDAMANDLPGHWVMFIAQRAGVRVAASLIAIDADQRLAWGRYWGCVEDIACLHFEACYYQPLTWCIAQGYLRFEGGAQGSHKMARGLLPVRTHSAHWLADPRFAQAVDDFLARETQGVEAWMDELESHQPFKPPPGP